MILKRKKEEKSTWTREEEGRNRVHEIKDHYIEKWQDRWDMSDRGRVLYVKIPNVRERIRNMYNITHYGTQFLTGHGNFRSYLSRFGLCETDKCKWCGISDTPEHVLYGCWKYTEERVELVRRLSELGIRLVREICRNTDAMVVFNEVVSRIGRNDFYM